MNLLVDTHAILWWITENKRLSPQARLLLGNPGNRRWVSIVSLWEIAIKSGTGKLPEVDAEITEIAGGLEKQEFVILPVRVQALEHLKQLAWLHRDPFDRLLIAQAMELGVPVLTADTLIRQYPIKTIW